MTSTELARRLQIPDASHITQKLAKALAPKPEIIRGPGVEWKDPTERISSGDVDLDSLLGGGITTGGIWELAGERFGLKTANIPSSIDVLTIVFEAHLEKPSSRYS